MTSELSGLASAAVILGGHLPPAERPARCPASGPRDVRVYATLHALARADGGLIGSDGRVAVVNAEERAVTLLDLEVVDELRGLKWVEEPDAVSLRVTEKGNYWLEKFHKANRLRIPG